MDFKRTNKQTGEIVIGKWQEICDLDKRIWTEPLEITAYFKDGDNLIPLTPTTFNLDRLASIKIKSNHHDGWYWMDIYNSTDLVGLYI